jgi:hypothetical protein
MSLIVFSVTATGQQTIPTDADAFFQKAMSQINQKNVAWVKRTATDANSKNLDENKINALAKSYGQLSGMSDMDVEALTFLVLTQASKDQQEELRNTTAKIKEANHEKERLRQAQQELEKNKTNISKTKLDSFRLIARPIINNNTRAIIRSENIQATQPVRKINTVPDQNPSKSELKEVQDELKGKLDSMNEMSEMTSLRLQMMMDRRSKFIITLSNIMKKIGATQDTIVQNMK